MVQAQYSHGTQATSFNPDDFDALLADNQVFMFTLKTCPYCKEAKDLLQEMGQDFYFVPVNDVGDDSTAAIQFADDETGDSKYPKIFINGDYIGGLPALQDLASDPDAWAADGLYVV